MTRPFGRGFTAALAFWPGTVPFGLVYAVIAGIAGLPAWQILLMSALVFAGASQFTAVGLLTQGAPAGVVIASTALINLRHILYGVSLAPYLPRIRGGLRAAVAFLLTDEAYSLGVRAYLEGRGTLAYYLGAGLSMFLSWNIGILAMAVVTFASRFLGLLGLPIRNAWTVRAMRLVPAAVFAGLVSGGLEVRVDAWLRWLAVGVGGFISWKGAPVWLSVGLGLAVYLAGSGLMRYP